MPRLKLTVSLIGVVLSFATAALAQEPAPVPVQPSGTSLPSYVLGPGDHLVIVAINAEEISDRPIRIGTSGDINVPMVGRVRAAGRTVEQLEEEVRERLKVYIREPDLAIHVTQFQSQPVSVLGAVGSPGVIQLEGRKNLLEVLSEAGGLRQDHGSRITITRKGEYGPIPLPSTTTYQEGYSIAELNIRAIMEASRPEENIQILPHDVIAVSTAEVVYVMGEVRRPGGFTLEDNETMSVLQALALAQGLGSTARAQDSRIIRQVPDSHPVEIAVDLRDLLQGKIADIRLEPDDILFVPDSFTRGALRRALDTAISAATGMVIYRRW